MREELPAARLRLGHVLMIAGLASLAPACGDGPICASDISVFITTPDTGAALFSEDGFGAEAEVVVRTNLRPSELVEVTVIDQFGQQFYLQTVPVDASGTARLPFVYLPGGISTLVARGFTEQCGTGEDAIEVEVSANPEGYCYLDAPEPSADPDYAPLGVYSMGYDANELVDGLQTTVDAYTTSEYAIELVLTDLRTGIETSVGTRSTDVLGMASYTLTLPQGPHALVARCTAPGGGQPTSSDTLQFHVDSLPPDCSLDAPAYGEDLTPAMDLDGDPSNGVQIELRGAVREPGTDELAPPPPLFRVQDVLFEGSELDEDDQSVVTVTLGSPGAYLMGIEAEDRVGNYCFDLLDFTYVGGSAIQVDAVTRSSVALSWTAPDPDGFGEPAAEYELRIGQDPIDADNFGLTGERYEIPPPAAPGTPESALVEGLPTGTTFYAALVARGALGSEQFIGAVGPLELRLDATPALGPVSPADGENGLGYQVAAGDFNGDGFSDVAVAAPFKSVSGLGGAGAVYIYFGHGGGLSATPDLTIEGESAGGQLGNGLTAMRWNDDAIDDLVVGAPFADAGQGLVLVYLGDAGLSGFRTPSDADVFIATSTEPGDWFVAGGFGFAMARARFDADERDDLLISTPGGGDGNGGVVVLYGGATSTLMMLSSLRPDDSGDAVAVVLQDPDPGSIFGSDPGPFFGQYVFPLGRTEGVADVDDDVGVAYTEKNAAVVFRGRPRPAAPGVTLASFDPARDLELVRTSSDDRTSRYGTAMGSIADINDDGVREIVVGMWRDLANIGRIEIYRGNAVGLARNASTVRLRSITPGAGLCGPSGCGLGSAIVNNAAGLVDPDVNGDGVEDLIVVGGMDAGRLELKVWFGGSLPPTDFTSDSAHYDVIAPAQFVAGARGDSDATPITALWAGDVNGDGLEDICWADWSAESRDGAFQLLYDDGL